MIICVKSAFKIAQIPVGLIKNYWQDNLFLYKSAYALHRPIHFIIKVFDRYMRIDYSYTKIFRVY